ncbi:MAG: NAD(P)/FAD-dependent oxidoreductase [Nitrososphaerales archaeon]
MNASTGAADALVVGGGIVGAACAYYLSRAGLRVQVLERRFFASGASRACDGLVLLWDKLSPAELELGKASANLWAALAEELPQDFEYRRYGSIVLAETGKGLAELHAKGRELAGLGIQAELLDAAGLRTLESNLAHDLPGGVFYPGDAQLDARLATMALLDAAARCGARLRQGVEVMGLVRGGGGEVTGVVTSAGPVHAASVVVAAGAWSGEMLRSEGLHVPVRPRKGHIVVASIRQASDLIRHPLAEGSYAASVRSSAADVQVALIAEKTAHDTLLLGSSREFCGFDLSVRTEIIQDIAARAVRFIPALAAVSSIRSYAGVRPWSPDHLPLIGPVPGFPGLFLATGHEGAGIGLAPVTGKLIAGYLAGSLNHDLAQGVWPDRFHDLAGPMNHHGG